MAMLNYQRVSSMLMNKNHLYTDMGKWLVNPFTLCVSSVLCLGQKHHLGTGFSWPFFFRLQWPRCRMCSSWQMSTWWHEIQPSLPGTKGFPLRSPRSPSFRSKKVTLAAAEWPAIGSIATRFRGIFVFLMPWKSNTLMAGPLTATVFGSMASDLSIHN